MTIADHGEPSVAWMLVTAREGAVAAGTTRVGVDRTTTGVMSHPRCHFQKWPAMIAEVACSKRVTLEPLWLSPLR